MPPKPARWLLRTVRSLLRLARRIRLKLADQLAERLRRISAARSVTVSTLEAILAANAEAHGHDLLARRAGEALALLGERRRARAKLFLAALNVFARDSLRSAIAFGEDWLDRVNGPKEVRALAGWHERAGAIRRPLELLASLED